MERSHPPPAGPSSGGSFCICYSWRQKAKGKTLFFSVCVSTTRWLPGASQTATTMVICTRPAQCHSGFPETLPFGVSNRTERLCQFPPWGVGLWKRRGLKGHCCLVALPEGFHPALPWVFGASGSGQASHSVPQPGSGSGWS